MSCRTPRVRAREFAAVELTEGSDGAELGHAQTAADAGRASGCRLCWNSNCLRLACPEGDDAPDRIVRRNTDGHAISRNDLDAEAAHAAAELGQHFVAGVALHAVKPAAVNRHDRALHVDEIVIAQTASSPFLSNNYCATSVANFEL